MPKVATATEALAAAVAAGMAVRAAAQMANVSERTGRRIVARPGFQSRVVELRAAMVSSAVGNLADSLGAAADVFRDLMTDENPHVRHKGAVAVFAWHLKVAEVEELEKRLAIVEQRLKAQDRATRQWR